MFSYRYCRNLYFQIMAKPAKADKRTKRKQKHSGAEQACNILCISVHFRSFQTSDKPKGYVSAYKRAQQNFNRIQKVQREDAEKRQVERKARQKKRRGESYYPSKNEQRDPQAQQQRAAKPQCPSSSALRKAREARSRQRRKTLRREQNSAIALLLLIFVISVKLSLNAFYACNAARILFSLITTKNKI